MRREELLKRVTVVRGRAEWRLALCKRRADSGGYDDRIAMPMNVHDRAITARAKVKDKLIGTLNRREWDGMKYRVAKNV